MFETFRNAWKIPDLRKKILFTLFIIIVFRIGSVIPVPFIDTGALKTAMSGATSDSGFFGYLSVFTGGAMDYGAVFAMGVSPYITASIIMQLLQVAIPALGRLAKEGEEGQKKIAKYSRFATVILGLIQGTAFYFYLKNSSLLLTDATSTMFFTIFSAVVIVLCFTAGSAVVMWLGEQVDKSGIGNGISMILFAGIISRVPQGVAYLWELFIGAQQYIQVIGALLIMLAVIVFIVFMTAAERRIPVQYAKRVVGRKMYGGQSTHMPIKVNMSGVMPIIFASSILAIPSTITAFMGTGSANSTIYKLLSQLSFTSPAYTVLYLILIIAFAYFYVTIQYDPVEMANNLRKNSGAVPGIRPGKPTSEYIRKILSRVTLIGALFLGVIAVLPTIVGAVGNIPLTLGGTSVLIVVGVAQETVQQIESQMLMRHYKGFLE